VDAVRRGSEPGTLHLLEPEVAAIGDLPEEVRRDFLADLHWADPGRVLILAKALGVLPPRVLILGCQPQDVEDLSLVLTPAVERTLPRALLAIDEALAQLTA
jgi:hydrogenase maturation protease